MGSGVTLPTAYTIAYSFGNDLSSLWIDGTDGSAKFSAWSYAKQRCRLICEAVN